MYIYILAVFLLIFGTNTAYGIDAPEYKEGDRWRVKYERNTSSSYSNVLPSGIYDIVFKDGDFRWYNASGELLAEGVRSEIPIFFGQYLAEEYGKKPREIPFLKFPLNVGDNRKFDYFNYNVGKRGMELEGTIHVTGIVPLETSVGQFSGYRHAMEEWGGSTTRTSTYHYVVECKCNLKYTILYRSGVTSGAEVLSFSVAQ